MAADRSKTRVSAQRAPQPAVKAPTENIAGAEPAVELPLAESQVSATLARADTPGRARLVMRLQKRVGNSAVQRLVSEALISRDPAAEAEAARVAKVKTDYAAAVSSGNWGEAGKALNAFNEPDSRERVKALSHAQRILLAAGTLESIPGYAKRVLDFIGEIDTEAVRVGQLEFDYKTAVKAAAWAKVAPLLAAYNDDDIKLKVAAFQSADLEALKAAVVAAFPGSAARITGPIDARLHSYGTISIAQTLTQGSATASYASDITITFAPTAKVNATEIAFLQTVRLVNTGTTVSRDARPNFAHRRTTTGWTLDRLDQRKLGWYGYNNSGRPSGTVTPGKGPSPLVSATMTDRPSWNIPGTQWDFETCAVAKDGTDKNQIYACITWGFTVDAANQITAHAVGQSNVPSGDFTAALGKWNTQASGPAADRNDANQEALPTITPKPLPSGP